MKIKLITALGFMGVLIGANLQANDIPQNLSDAIYDQVDHLDFSDGAQDQFLGKVIDVVKDAGSKVFSTLKSATKKVISVGKKVAKKAAPFIKEYGPSLIKKGASLAATLLPLAANIIAPEFAIPVEIAAGLVAAAVEALGPGKTDEQYANKAAELAEDMVDDL